MVGPFLVAANGGYATFEGVDLNLFVVAPNKSGAGSVTACTAVGRASYRLTLQSFSMINASIFN